MSQHTINDIEPFVIQVARKGGETKKIQITRNLIDELMQPVSPENFITQAQILPKQIALIGSWLAFSKSQVDQAHSGYREWRSKAELQIRKPPANAKELGWKKPTDAATDATVRTLPEWRKHQNALIKYQRQADTMGHILDSLQVKRDVLKMLQHEFRKQEERSPANVKMAV
jgi:hypothetical protein